MTAPEDWHHAACRGRPVVWWFPPTSPGPGGVGGQHARARAICATCPHLVECADWAVAHDHDLHGIWGGMSPTERVRERELRRHGRLPVCDLCGERFPSFTAMRAHITAGQHPRLSHPTRILTHRRTS